MSPMFRGERDRDRPAQALHQGAQPLRMVLDDDTVERLRVAALDYGMEVEELMVAILQVGAERVRELLGEPPTPRTAT